VFQVEVYAGAKELGTRSLNSRTWEFYKEKEFAAWKLKQENKMHVGLLNSLFFLSPSANFCEIQPHRQLLTSLIEIFFCIMWYIQIWAKIFTAKWGAV
jgi:hypothetical protein